MEVLACSILENGVFACSDRTAEAFFTTRVGPPDRPPMPDVVFANTTVVDVSVNTEFSWGAQSVSRWEVMVARAEDEFEGYEAYKITMDGHKVRQRINLESLNDAAGWSPDCNNASNSNLFNFSVKAVVKDPGTGHLYESPWSEAHTLPAYCKPAFPWKIALGVCIGLPILVLAALVVACRAGNWFKSKHDLFRKLGKELDQLAQANSQHVVKAGLHHPGHDFNMAQLGHNRTEDQDKPPGHNRAGSLDSTEKLLNEGGQKMQHLSGQSDTTSGCDSGRSSDAGSTTPDRSPNVDHADSRWVQDLFFSFGKS